MTFRTGDTGKTRGGIAFRIIADDAKGDRGPVIALLTIGEEEMVYRFPATGVHQGGHRAYDLPPAAVPA